jgi:hypothetical protein
MLDLAAHRKDRTVAFVAALVLLLQALFVSWAHAAPHSMALDDFGNPLCVTSADQGTPPADTPTRLPNCCTLGCSMASAVLLPPSLDALPARRDAATDIRVPRPRDLLPPARPAYGPGSPRAPPLTV